MTKSEAQIRSELIDQQLAQGATTLPEVSKTPQNP